MKIADIYFESIKSLVNAHGINDYHIYNTHRCPSGKLNDKEKTLMPNVMFWDPLGQSLINSLLCPHCKQDGFKSFVKNSDEWEYGQSKSQIPRAIWDDGWYCALVGKTYFCPNKHQINSYHAGVIDQIPVEKIPFMLTFKTGMTKTLFHRIIRYLEVGTSFSGIESLLGGFLLDECNRRWMVDNKKHFEKSQVQNILVKLAPTHQLIRQCFVMHYEGYKHLYKKGMDRIPFKSLSFDHTFKVATNIGYWKDNRWVKEYDSMFIVMNEEDYVKSYQFTKGTALNQVTNLLKDLQGQGDPKLIMVDNCCQLKNQVLSIFPRAEVKLDLFHAVQRLVKTISKKHYFCTEFSRRVGAIFRSPEDLDEDRKMPTPSPTQLLKNIKKFLEEWDDVNYKSWKIVNGNFLHEIEKLKKHVNNNCLSEIPPGHGTNRNQNLHKNLKSILQSKRMGIQTANALFAQVIYSHNSNGVVTPIWALGQPNLPNAIFHSETIESSLLSETDFVFNEIVDHWSTNKAIDHSYGETKASKFF